MKFDFPFAESIIIYIGLVVIFLGIIILSFFIFQAVQRSIAKRPKKEKSPKKERIKLQPGCLTFLAKTLIIAFLVASGLMIVFLGAFVQSMTSFTREVLVAEVTFEEINANNRTMKVILVEKKGNNANVRQEFFLIGDQWFVRGDIIKWDSWLNFFGLHTMYKLTRIGGYFDDPRRENREPPTNYSLVPEEETPKWRWLYKYGYELPFVNDVYGNSVYKYPQLNRIFKIYVTPTGFTIGTEDK